MGSGKGQQKRVSSNANNDTKPANAIKLRIDSLSLESWNKFLRDSELSNKGYADYYLRRHGGNYTEEQINYVLDEVLRDLVDNKKIIRSGRLAANTLTIDEEEFFNDFDNRGYHFEHANISKKATAFILKDKNNEEIIKIYWNMKNSGGHNYIDKGRLLNCKMGTRNRLTPVEIVFKAIANAASAYGK